jgi:limonene-1,2-epoxide hydrolase
MSDESPTETVLRFCAAWSDLDVDAICEWFTDDAVYHNIPIDPVTGREAIKGMIQTFTTGVKSIEFRVRNHAANGNVVMTERVDAFVMPDKTIELPVMGTFEVTADGRISAWRDYFDLNQFMSQMAPPTS